MLYFALGRKVKPQEHFIQTTQKYFWFNDKVCQITDSQNKSCSEKNKRLMRLSMLTLPRQQCQIQSMMTWVFKALIEAFCTVEVAVVCLFVCCFFFQISTYYKSLKLLYQISILCARVTLFLLMALNFLALQFPLKTLNVKDLA